MQCDHQTMNSPRPKLESCAQVRGGHYPTDETVGFVWLHPSFPHHRWPLKPHCPPLFPLSKSPCATQSRRGLVKPARATRCSAAFGKKGVISKAQGRRSNNWPARREHFQHSRGQYTLMFKGDAGDLSRACDTWVLNHLCLQQRFKRVH